MAGESAAWRKSADSMFAGAGDVVKSATVYLVDEGAFDPNQGRDGEDLTTVKDVKLLWTGGVKRYQTDGVDGQLRSGRVAIVQGSKFVGKRDPRANDRVKVESTTYIVIGVSDAAGTGAYFELGLGT